MNKFLLTLGLAGGVSQAIASITSDGLRACHRAAANDLVACLDEHAGSVSGDTCWPRAQAALALCVEQLQPEGSELKRQQAERLRLQQRKPLAPTSPALPGQHPLL